MNDRFKFRAYNKELRKMYEVDTICPYEDNYTKGGEVFLKGIQYNSFYFPEEVEVMQCSGLKDKNGKLIYEGDIVEDVLMSKFTITFNDEYLSYLLTNIKTNEQMVFYPNIKLEVIGNRYENKELLEDTECQK